MGTPIEPISSSLLPDSGYSREQHSEDGTHNQNKERKPDGHLHGPCLADGDPLGEDPPIIVEIPNIYADASPIGQTLDVRL